MVSFLDFGEKSETLTYLKKQNSKNNLTIFNYGCKNCKDCFCYSQGKTNLVISKTTSASKEGEKILRRVHLCNLSEIAAPPQSP